jgi:predicted anti-sigma-YlaC factor YlaD
MNCTAARDLMPELALGSLATRDAASIERHLAWCAACRKEAGDLHRAAALLPYALASSDPPRSLEARVVGVVREAAGGHGTTWARRGRSGVAALIAAMVAVSALGWGAVMAGRADRLEAQKRVAVRQRAAAVHRIEVLLDQATFGSHDNVFVGTLGAEFGSPAGGAALELLSPNDEDSVIVSLIGLPATDRPPLPYTVMLESGNGARALVGKVNELDTSGSADIARFFKRDLSGLTRVVVRDAEGAFVMSGTLILRDTVPSPSPS